MDIRLQMLKTAAGYVARAAISAGIGVIVANQLTKAGTVISNEYHMYRAYRAAHKDADHTTYTRKPKA